MGNGREIVENSGWGKALISEGPIMRDNTVFNFNAGSTVFSVVLSSQVSPPRRLNLFLWAILDSVQAVVPAAL